MEKTSETKDTKKDSQWIQNDKKKESFKNYHREQKATIKQKRVVQGLLEGKNAKTAIVEAGYSVNTAANPKTVLSAPGFIALLDEIGLSDTFLSEALKQDIEKKPGKRVEELKLAYKLRGRLKDEQNIGVNFIQNVTESRERYGL